MIPNLFLVGPPKTGTTSIYESLGLHPRVFCPQPKEPCFLTWCASGAPHWAVRDRSCYLKSYASARPAQITYAVDGSTWAFSFSGVADQVKSISSSPRVIVTLRSPVDRIVSQYLFNVSNGWEKAPTLKHAIDREFMGLVPDACLDRSYIRGSTYSLRLREYLEVIGSDAVKVILFDDLCKDYKKTFLDLLNWLGLDYSEQFEPVVSNKTSGSIARRLVNHSRFKASIYGIWRVTPTALRRFVKRSDVFFSKRSNLSKQRIDEETLLFLREYFSSEVLSLSEIIGKNLVDMWDLPVV